MGLVRTWTPALFSKCVKQLRDKPSDRRVNDGEVCGESEDSDNDDGGCGPDLLPGRPGNPAHFLFQLLKVIFGLRGPLTGAFNPAIRFHEISVVLRFLAGAEGLEPPNAVLETAVLPLKLRPYLAKDGLSALYQLT
jgi:hypothetical protein